MTELTELSARILDEGAPIFPVRIHNELSEVSDGLAVVESFSNIVALRTAEGLVLADTSSPLTAEAALASLRRWSADPVHTVIYTHGHVDHVGGARLVLADAEERRHPRPRFVAHENVPARLERYELTDGYNTVINRRQFGDAQRAAGELGRAEARRMGIGGLDRFLPEGTPRPDRVFRDRLGLELGGLRLELRHARGETDDHLWVWLPEQRTILAGDFFIWNFPNAGNPQKVQRYPLEWAAALREMAALEPELLVPAHGLPIAGRERVRRVLEDTAHALETLVRATLERMNAGATLDEILQSVRLPDETLAKPYLRPLYDEPEFVVRNVWRLYGGWYDGDPSHLKPAPARQLAAEIAALAGGAGVLARRARELAEKGELRLACHLAELAAQAAPGDREVHAARAAVYAARRERETSLMARAIYAAAARESEAKR